MDGLEEVLNRYLAVIDAEDSLLKSYRSFFLVLEGLIFPVILYIGRSNTGFLSLYNISGGKISVSSPFIGWYLFIITGFLLCFIWIFVTSHRGCILDNIKRDMDKLMERMVKGERIPRMLRTRFIRIAYGEYSSMLCTPMTGEIEVKTSNYKNIRMERNIWLNLYRTLIHANFIGPAEKKVPRATFNFLLPVIIMAFWCIVSITLFEICKLLFSNPQNLIFIIPFIIPYLLLLFFIIFTVVLYVIFRRKGNQFYTDPIGYAVNNASCIEKDIISPDDLRRRIEDPDYIILCLKECNIMRYKSDMIFYVRAVNPRIYDVIGCIEGKIKTYFTLNISEDIKEPSCNKIIDYIKKKLNRDKKECDCWRCIYS